MSIVVLVIILLLLGGGGYGWRSGYYGPGVFGGGILALVVLVVLVWYLFPAGRW